MSMQFPGNYQEMYVKCPEKRSRIFPGHFLEISRTCVQQSRTCAANVLEITKTSSNCRLDFQYYYRKCPLISHDISRTIAAHVHEMSKKWPWKFREMSKICPVKCPGHFLDIFKTFQWNVCLDFSMNFQGSCLEISGKCPGNPQEVFATFPDTFKTFP